MVLWREWEKQSNQIDHGGFADFSGKPLFFCLNRAFGGGEKKEEFGWYPKDFRLFLLFSPTSLGVCSGLKA